MLNAWNLLADIAFSIGFDLDDHGDAAFRVYEKLFAGTNLPAMTPPGRAYEPAWDADEAILLARILGDGLKQLRTHAPFWSDSLQAAPSILLPPSPAWRYRQNATGVAYDGRR